MGSVRPLDALPYGCNCDPGEAPGPGHSLDCPAYETEAMAVGRMRSYLPLFERLAAEMDRQHQNYGPFVPDVRGVRLAAAALEDEAEEVRRAWRDERKADGWAHTEEEAMQVAAVAARLVVALGDQNEEAKADSRSASSDDKVYASFNEALEDCFPHEAKRRRRAVVPPESWEHDDQLRMIVGPRGQKDSSDA